MTESRVLLVPEGLEGERVDAALARMAYTTDSLEAARTTYPDLVLSLDTWRSEVVLAAEGLVDL